MVPNIAPFEPRLGQELGARDIVVTVASDSRLKNVKGALKAWPSVLLAFPNAQLHLIGHGLGESEDLADWARRYSFGRGVYWHGYISRERLHEVLSAASMLLHPSHEEAQPLVLLEAMALGLPVVAGASAGGVGWTVGNAGILVDVTLPEAIASGVKMVLGNRGLRRRLGSSGVRRVLEVFSSDAVGRAYEAEYALALGQAQRR